MGANKPPPSAYVVDVDETSGKAVSGSRRNATKEKPKVSHKESRSSKNKKPVGDTGYLEEKSSGDAQRVVALRDEKDMKLERRKSTTGNIKSPRKSGKPPSSHGNALYPQISIPGKSSSKREESSHYGGIPTPTPSRAPPVVSQPIAIRPRPITAQTCPPTASTRPLSFHQAYTPSGGYGPPLSMSAYYQGQPQIPAPSQSPSSSTYTRYAPTPQPIAAPQPDYFSNSQHLTGPIRPLSARFDTIPRTTQLALDPITRTTSAFGLRDAPRQLMSDAYDAGYYEDSYVSRDNGRRGSIRVPSGLSKAETDYVTMPPPPPRPHGILRRPTIDYSFDSGDIQDTRDARLEYRDPGPRYRDDPSPRRPSSNRNSVSYDLGKDSERVRIETANNGRRRQSYYGQSTQSTQSTQSASTGSSGYEDKMTQAASYQQDLTGPSVPLTADLLRKQQRREAGSSRSTKSSGSRDESDYRKSATTRTTRSVSGNDDENVTIKVTGQARVMVGGAQIDCNDGGQIQIVRQKGIRNGSERSHSEFGGPARIDDRPGGRSRIAGPPGRSRLSSRSRPRYALDSTYT